MGCGESLNVPRLTASCMHGMIGLIAMHPAQFTTDDLVKDCSIKLLRRGGPGGQHRNKVETAVVIEHLPSGIRAEANERRSQLDNRRIAIRRLRLLLAIKFRSPLDTDASGNVVLRPPSELWLSRVANSRIRVSVEHDDFPAMLSELLDVLSALQFDVTSTAEHFGISSSQLIGLIRHSPAAMSSVNEARALLGMHRLR